MRFGWLAAAAAMVCAGQASAQTWVKYEVSGTGYQRPTDGGGVFNGPASAKDVSASFIILVGPPGTYSFLPTEQAGSIFKTDGNVFTASVPSFRTFEANGTQSGLLTGSQNIAVNGGGGSAGSFTINYTDLDAAGGFPTFLGTYAITGSIGFQQFGSGQGSGINTFANLTRLAISSANGFQLLNVTAVPEPASWAMMIFGVGAIGAVTRRKRSAPAAA
jgi:hypothetical protein